MNLELQTVKAVLEIVVSIVILLGAPAGLYQYYRAVKKEQRDREYGTYNALDDKFLDFQRLCLEYPYLDIFDVPDITPAPLTPEQRKQELVAFTCLFSIFERAYLMYHDQSTAVRQRQWSGWDTYIQRFCKRQNFRRAWIVSGATFDESFDKYMTQFVSVDQSPNNALHPTGARGIVSAGG